MYDSSGWTCQVVYYGEHSALMSRGFVLRETNEMLELVKEGKVYVGVVVSQSIAWADIGRRIKIVRLLSFSRTHGR